MAAADEALGKPHADYVEGTAELWEKAFRAASKTRTGDEETIDGWIVFRTADLRAQGVNLRKGDLVVSVGDPGQEVAMSAEIMELRYESPLRGGFLLLYAELAFNSDQRGGVR